MRTITAMFDSRADAENARSNLTSAGISADNVTIHDKGIMGNDRPEPDYAHAGENDRASAYAGTSSIVGSTDVGESGGAGGSHRDALGNFRDERTGRKIGEDAGSDRNALGDFVDASGHRRGSESGDYDNRHQDKADDDRSLWDRIKAFFTDDEDVYAEGLRRGGYLLTARVEDHDAERAIAILDVDGVVDLDQRQASWRQEGWSGSARDQGSAGERGRVRTYERADWPL